MNTYDSEFVKIADYLAAPLKASDEAYQTARAGLADALGCAMLALRFPQCTKLLGPIVPGTTVPSGSCVPGTEYVLDPIRAAFDIGTMIRWLDYNDAWLAAEWGHPSDNLGAILALGDYLTRSSKKRFSVQDILTCMIQAYEIQGVLALQNSFNRIGFDHVILVKIASTAVATKMLGGTHQQIMDALSNAFIDAGPLRTYRHAPNTGSRKSWAAGDATSRGVLLAFMTMQGEMGYPTALSAKKWGFCDVLFQGKPLVLERPLGSYVMENILFKVSFPAEFHAQTAVECAFKLYPQVKDRLDEIESVEISTHESALRIIDKKGPLHNPADRDHCIQYMVAIALLFGELTAHHYEEKTAQDPHIDLLRSKMTVSENKQYSIDYLDPNKRSVANSLLIRMKGGEVLGPVTVEYPLGHRQRRAEGLPLIFKKFEHNVGTHLPPQTASALSQLFQNQSALTKMSISDLIDLFNSK